MSNHQNYFSEMQEDTKSVSSSVVKIYSSRHPIEQVPVTSLPEPTTILELHPRINKKKIIVIIISIALVLLAIALGVTLFLVLKNKEKEDGSIEEKEELIIHIERKINEVSRYQEIKYSEVIIALDDKSNSNKQKVYTDILFNIYKVEKLEHFEIKIYHAYAVIINMTMEIEGNSTFVGGFDIYNISNNNNESNGNDNDNTTEDDNMFPEMNQSNCTSNKDDDCEQNILSIPLTKFSFFENGTLHQLYKPVVVDAFLWTSLTDLIRQFTPQLSKKLYNSTTRCLQDFESTNRNATIGANNSKLNEVTVNHGGYNGLAMSDSSIKTSISTTVDNSVGKISYVESSSQCNFQKSNTTIPDIEVNENSALNDIDTSDNANVVTNGFDSLTTKVDSTISLIYSQVELNTTELIMNITSLIKFSLITNEEIVDGNRLRHLLKFPYKEYKKDINKMPREISLMRILGMESFNTPIDFSYAIFKYNLLGLQMGLHVVTTVNVENDESTVAIVLKVESYQLEIFSIAMKTGIADKLIKAYQIIKLLTSKLISLGNEQESDFRKFKLTDLVTKGGELKDKLTNVFDIGKILEDPCSILQSSIFDVVRDKISLLADRIVFNVNKFNSILSSIKIEGKSVPDRLIELLKSNTQSLFEYGKKAFELFNEKILAFLTTIGNNIINIDEIGSDIYLGAQESIQKIIDVYDSYVENILSGVINGVNNVITTFTDKLQLTIGKILDNIILILSKNPFIIGLTTPELRNNLIASIKSIQSTIFNQVNAVLSMIRLSDDALPNHEITKDADFSLRQFVFDKKTSLRDIAGKLMTQLKEKFNQGIKIGNLIINLDSIDKIEDVIKNIKAEGFKSFFNIPLLFGDINKYLDNSVTDMIQNQLIEKENSLQLIMMEIKSLYQTSIEGIKNELITIMTPMLELIQTAFNGDSLNILIKPLFTKIDGTLPIIIGLIDYNFQLANDYVNEVISFANKNSAFFNIFRTKGFYDNVNKGRNSLNDIFKIIKENISSSFTLLLSSIKTQVDDLLKQIIGVNKPRIIIEYKELAFINDVLDIIGGISTKVNQFFDNASLELTTKVNGILAEITAHFNKKVLEYDNNIKTFDWATYLDSSCELIISNNLPGAPTYFCINPTLTENMNKFKELFDLPSSSKEDDEKYNFIVDQQQVLIDVIFKSFNQIEVKIQKLIKKIVTDSPQFNTLLESWKKMALDFESKYLNKNIKDTLFQNFNSIIKTKSQEFIAYARSNLNTNMQKYFDLFTSGIGKFTSQPKEIPFRLNQLLSFVSKDLLNMNEEIELTLSKALDYGLNYTYSIIGNQFESFLVSYKDNFMGDMNSFLANPIKERLISIVNDIRSSFEAKLHSLLNLNSNGLRKLDGPIDLWNLTWISSEIQNNIIPQFQLINTNIQSEINNKLGHLVDDFTIQSKKLDYSLSNTLKESSSLFEIAKTALDSCLSEFKIAELVESFKTMGKNTIEFLKKELLALNKRFNIIENIITSKFNSNSKSRIASFFSIDKVNTIFSAFIEKIFTLALNVESLFSEILTEFKQNLSKAINDEVERIKIDNYKIANNYFITLYSQIELQVIEKLNSFVTKHLDGFYQILLDQIKEKFKDRMDELIISIETQVSSHLNMFSILDLFNSKFDIKEVIQAGITLAKETFNSYYDQATNIIQKQYASLKLQISNITVEIATRLKGIFEWSKTDLLNKFTFTSGSDGNKPSSEFQSSISRDVSLMIDNSIQKIKDMNILNTVQSNIRNIDLAIANIFNLDNIKPLFEALLTEIKDEIKTEIFNQKTQIAMYLQEQLASQSFKSLSLLFNADFYKNLKEKCVDNNIKLAFNFINSKIQEITNYAMFILKDTINLSGSFMNLVPLLVNGFSQQFQSLIQDLLVNKINSKLGDYLSNTQSLVIDQFEGLFENLLIESKELINVSSIITDQINSFDKNQIKKIFNDFYTNELTQAKSMFIQPMENEIRTSITKVKDKLKEQFDQIIDECKKKIIDAINDKVEELLGDTKGVISKIGEVVDGKIIDYLLKPDKTVEETIGIIIEKLTTSLGPITEVLSSIRDKIEEKIDLSLSKVTNLAVTVNDKLNTNVFQKITETKEKIIKTLDNIKLTIIDKVITFESEIFNWFFPKAQSLRSLPSPDVNDNINIHLRSTLTFGVAEAKDAIETFKSSLHSIKNSLKSLDIIGYIQAAYDKYKDKILNGLGVMKQPVIFIINQITTIFDEAFLLKIENKVEDTLIKIRDIGMTSINKVKDEITEVVFYFKEYPSSLIEDLISAVKVQTNIELTNLVNRVIEKFVPTTISYKKDFSPVPIFKATVPLFGLPLFFDVMFSYGYDIGLEVKAKDLNIYLSAYCGGYAIIEARAYLSVMIAEFGGKITGLMGKGKISIGPSFSLTTFKVHLQAGVFLQAFEFKAIVFATYPWISFEIQCRRIFGFKICIKWPKLLKKTIEYGFTAYKGLKYEKQWDKLY